MTKKRKLNSRNPKYWDSSKTEGPEILKKIRMADATIRDSQMRDTGKKAKVHAIFYKS
jgi:hypothetical protein